jgi:hypothetical protein
MFSKLLPMLIIYLYSNYSFLFVLEGEYFSGSLFSDPILNMALFPTIIKRKRSNMPKEEKIRVSNNIPEWFKQVVCGLMLSDASIRLNGSPALMGIQETHKELTQ